MSEDNQLDVHDLPEELRALVSECEVTGRRTLFLRNRRPVALLTSYDEYLALRETVEIVKDGALLAKITAAEEEARRNALLAVEDLLEG